MLIRSFFRKKTSNSLRKPMSKFPALTHTVFVVIKRGPGLLTGQWTSLGDARPTCLGTQPIEFLVSLSVPVPLLSFTSSQCVCVSLSFFLLPICHPLRSPCPSLCLYLSPHPLCVSQTFFLSLSFSPFFIPLRPSLCIYPFSFSLSPSPSPPSSV